VVLRRRTAAVTAGALIGALGLCGHAIGDGAGSAQLAPLTLTEAGVDGHRHPFARWDPAWPLVNILVSTRPVRSADDTPALRYWVQAGFYGALSDGPERVWRGDDPLIPGVYYTSVSGDAPFEYSPFTPFKRVTVKPRRGEWTGPTSQKRYIRFTRPAPRVLGRVSFSIFGPNDGCRSSFVLHRRIRLREDGRFSLHLRQVWNLEGQSQGDVRISGRVRDRSARGTLRVERLFEGCGTGPVSWSARRR
jgi:hypothetical protein